MSQINIGASTDRHYRYKMDRLETKVEGRGNGIKTVFPNLVDVAQQVGRPPIYVLKYFGSQLGAQTKYDKKNDRYILNGEHDRKELEDILQEGFIKKFVTCGRCNNPETIINIGKNDSITLECKACGASTTVDPREKLCAVILRDQKEDKPKKKKDRKSKKEAPAVVSPIELLQKFVVVKKAPTDVELVQAVMKIQKDFSFGEREVTCLVCEGLLAADTLNFVKERTGLLQKFVNKSSSQKTLLGYLEKFAAQKESTLKQLPHIVMHLYDNDILDEDVFLAWHDKKKSKLVSTADAHKVRAILQPIVDWLKSAEVEA